MMKRLWRAAPVGLIAVMMIAACRAPAETTVQRVASLDKDFVLDTLVIETNDGSAHTISVYLALTIEQQRQGLMFVRNMPDDVGMLFVYEESGRRSMWMKNTYISLDMIFARADGTVSSVIHDTTPLSLESRGAIEPITFVLELNAGIARRLGIDAGSRLIWSPPGDSSGTKFK